MNGTVLSTRLSKVTRDEYDLIGDDEGGIFVPEYSEFFSRISEGVRSRRGYFGAWRSQSDGRRENLPDRGQEAVGREIDAAAG